MTGDKLDFNEVMRAAREGLYGPWHQVRDQVTDTIIEERWPNTEDGISSSDINHTLFGMVRMGVLELEIPDEEFTQ